MANDIFISYRRKGGFETAKHLYDLLKHDGYTVSFDIDTLRSGNFDTALLKLIDECTDFILILNDTAFDRSLDPKFDRKYDWLRNELAYALEKKKNIIPIMLDGFTEFPKNLPSDIEAVQWKNGPAYSRDYFDTFYGKLKSWLQSRPTQSLVQQTTPPLVNASSSGSNNNLKKVAYIVVAVIALIWIFSKFNRSSEASDSQDSLATVEIVDNTNANIETQQTAGNRNQSTPTQRVQTPKANPSTNATLESGSSQSQSMGNSSNAEASQLVQAAPTQTTTLPEATPKEPAAAPVELSAAELVSKGRSAVKKFKASEGAEYFKQAIAKGSVEANYYLGDLYYTGNGVGKSFPTAKSYFQKAAQAGMVDAQYMMGVMLRNGQGGDKDIDGAKQWLQKAASQGHANAERLLKQIN